MKIAVPMFPGASSALELIDIYNRILGQQAYAVDYREQRIGSPDAIVIPGGSSFGDVLRPGALAKVTKVAGSIRRFCSDGGPVLGIGNGFQLLCELGVLPGVLLVNSSLKLLSKNVIMRSLQTESRFSKVIPADKNFVLPICCYFGSYWADQKTLNELEREGQVAFRYCDRYGDLSETHDLCDSSRSIAGIVNRKGNVLGLMARPDYAAEPISGSEQGLEVLKAITS